MKIVQSILIIALLAITIPSHAKDGDRLGRKVKQKVATIVSSTSTDLEGAVNAQFKLTADGTLEVVSVESSTYSLKELVNRKLSKIKIKGETIDVNKIFNINFIFHREKG